MQVKVFNILTNGSGAYVGTLPMKTPAKLVAAQWVDGDLVDGVDATLICTDFSPRDSVRTLLALVNANDDAFYYPKVTGDTAAGVEITDAYESPLVHGTLQLTVAAGGSAKVGALWLYLEE